MGKVKLAKSLICSCGNKIEFKSIVFKEANQVEHIKCKCRIVYAQHYYSEEYPDFGTINPVHISKKTGNYATFEGKIIY